MTSDRKIVMEYTGPWKVVLTYFKESGKYYSEGEYLSNELHMYEIFAEVREMLDRGTRPGLVDGFDMPYVLVQVPNHPHEHPALVVVPQGKG